LVRIKEFLTGVQIGFEQTWAVVEKAWEGVNKIVGSVVESLDGEFNKLGINIGKNTSDIDKWKALGTLVGKVIVGQVVPAIILLAAGFSLLVEKATPLLEIMESIWDVASFPARAGLGILGFIGDVLGVGEVGSVGTSGRKIGVDRQLSLAQLGALKVTTPQDATASGVATRVGPDKVVIQNMLDDQLISEQVIDLLRLTDARRNE
jgi:hypothetical protein